MPLASTEAREGESRRPRPSPVLILTGASVRPGAPVPTVLFLCPDHTFTSRMAEALFNAGAPPGWRATSAGIGPARPVDRKLAPVLSALGLPLPAMEPRSWDPTLLGFMRVVVSVVEPEGPGMPPALVSKLEFRWRRTDPTTLSGMALLAWVEELRAPVASLGDYCRERTPRILG